MSSNGSGSSPGSAVVVVLLTASAEDADIATAYRLGANGFLVKPSEASKLEDMVKAIKHFWLTHNTLPQECRRERPAAPAHLDRSGRDGVGHAAWAASQKSGTP